MGAKVIRVRTEELVKVKTERWFASVKASLLDQLVKVRECDTAQFYALKECNVLSNFCKGKLCCGQRLGFFPKSS